MVNAQSNRLTDNLASAYRLRLAEREGTLLRRLFCCHFVLQKTAHELSHHCAARLRFRARLFIACCALAEPSWNVPNHRSSGITGSV
jgi:hypothetical protein